MNISEFISTLQKFDVDIQLDLIERLVMEKRFDIERFYKKETGFSNLSGTSEVELDEEHQKTKEELDELLDYVQKIW